MNTKTLKVLKGSIKKWEKIVEGTGIDEGTDNCPLCELFYYKDCHGCPVYEKTNCPDCIDTPCGDWNEHIATKHKEKGDYKVYCPVCKELAQKELDFLKSLLPRSQKLKLKIKGIKKIFCKLGFHKTVIVSAEQWYKVVCIKCNKQWDEDKEISPLLSLCNALHRIIK